MNMTDKIKAYPDASSHKKAFIQYLFISMLLCWTKMNIENSVYSPLVIVVNVDLKL